MLVVDVETTGTNPHKHSLLSIGAVDFTDPTREFYEECRAWEGAHVEDEALAINGVAREKVFDPLKKTEAQIVKEFLAWAATSPDHTFAGQNPSFDVTFILAAAERAHINASIPHRTVDLHTIATYHMIKRGLTIPLQNKRSDLDSDAIMTYIGIPPEVHPHIGINGARIEAEAFSCLFYDKHLYPQYEKYKISWL